MIRISDGALISRGVANPRILRNGYAGGPPPTMILRNIHTMRGDLEACFRQGRPEISLKGGLLAGPKTRSYAVLTQALSHGFF